MINLVETNKKDLILRRKVEVGNLWGHKKKLLKEIFLNDKKIKIIFPEKYRYLEWNQRRDDNGKKCTIIVGKAGQI